MTKLIPRVGVSAAANSWEVGANRADKALADLVSLLNRHGVEVVPTERPVTSADAATAAGRLFAAQRVDAVCLAAASWFEDYFAIDMLEECNMPLFLWPLPGMETGSLCGAQQATSVLKQLDRPFKSAFGHLEDGAALDTCLSFLRAAALRARLRRARVGFAGSRVGGMSEVSANEIALKRVLGPRVVPIDMVSLLARARDEGRLEKTPVWSRVKAAAGRSEVPDEDGLSAAGVYLALKERFRAEGLSALAFGCYPGFMGCACLAASLMADEGMPIGCEGDVNGAVAMLMLALLTGQPTHNTDWLDPMADGSVVFTHCGSGSYSLAEKREDITIAPVRLAHKGVCSLFPARPGPVTLVNLMPLGNDYQMAVMEGEALPVEMVFPGNPLRVRFPAATARIIDWIHDEGIGHHWVAGYGHVGCELADLARMIGPRLRFIIH